MKVIRWLHLSDFHSGKDEYGQKCLFSSIIDEIKRKIAEAEPPDYIFITGDIANKGLKEEYFLFEDKFLQPLKQVKNDNNLQFKCVIIPGNHDVNRNESESFDFSDILKRQPTFFDPTEEGMKVRKDIFPRFSNFSCLNTINEPLDWLFSKDGSYCRIDEIDGELLGIVGINSAWLSKDNNDRHNLSFGKNLLEEALQKIKHCRIKIVLAHHPIDWLLDSETEAIRAILGKYNVIYLHGHLHKSQSKFEEGAGMPFRVIQAGASFDTREDDIHKNRILWCELNIKENSLFLEPYQWNLDNQEWCLDGTAFPKKFFNNKIGKWVLEIPFQVTNQIEMHISVKLDTDSGLNWTGIPDQAGQIGAKRPTRNLTYGITMTGW